MTHRPYTPPAWQAKPLADGRVTLLVVPLKVQPKYEYRSWETNLPYAPGDLIWCREAYRGSKGYDAYPPSTWSHWPVHYEIDGRLDEDDDDNGKLRSPVTMPKWAARTWLRCTGVEVRRVQTITADEASEVGTLQFEHKGDYNALDSFYSMWMQTYGSYDQWSAFAAVEKISKEDV